MVEPFAAVILNSLASGRSTLRSSSSLNSAARVMTNSPRPYTSSDFFTPQPRRAKGKERAVNTLNLPCHLLQCQEWSSCAQRHSLWCPHQSRFLMIEEFDSSPGPGPVHRYTSQNTSRPLNYHSRTHSMYAGQRRHVSHATELAGVPSTSASLPTQPGEATQRLQSMLQLADEAFDLETAWETYTSVLECDGLSSLNLEDLLAFSSKLIGRAEALYQREDDLETIHQWGHRIEDVLTAFKSQIPHSSSYDYLRQCLLARTMALVGDLERAIGWVHAADKIPLVYEQKAEFLKAYEGVMMSTWRHHGTTQVLELIIIEWLFIGSYLTKKASKWHHSSPAMLGRSLREAVGGIISAIESPAILLADKTHWDTERREQMGSFLIEVLCDQELPNDALDVFREMKKQHLPIPVGLHLTLVRSLARQNMFEDANKLYSSLPNTSNFKYYSSTGLYLHAHQGDNVQAESYYNLLADHGWIGEYDTTMLLYSYATQGKTEKVEELFNKFFPEGPDGSRLNSPTLPHYSTVILGHAQHGNIEGINYWLESASKAGLVPNVHVYTIILKSFALRGDIDSVIAVLDQMRAAQVPPNVVSYTTVITLLAHRKDLHGAEVIYKRALQEGIVPDRRMISSMMNAHVEAGSWKGVIRIFDYIKSSPNRRIRLTIEVYNTLLKSYVLIGAPFHIVSKLFAQLEKSKVKPDAYTFALLVQSACDAGHMKIATNIFYEMDSIDKGRQSAGLVNAYVLTILMAGFLRTGDKIRAKAVYDDMNARGIRPSSISFGTILRAYGNERTKESMEIAEKFIDSLMEAPVQDQAWNRPTYGRQAALDHIYGPVIHSYGKQEKVEDMERLFKRMVDAGGTPSLGTLSALLDAYRRTFNIDAVLDLWPQIFQLGLQYSKGVRLAGKHSKLVHSNIKNHILCVPLSIYIDALSAAGMHMEIATTWEQLQNKGLTFDSHNWNHLVVALVRAGEPERAFAVLEKIILPYQRQSELYPRGRVFKPFEPTTNEGEYTSPPSEPPMHSSVRRATAVTIATSKISHVELEDSRNRDDFVHPLDILHQVSPAWAAWRPHTTSLSILLMVLSRLESGALVDPITRDNSMDISRRVNEPTEAREMLNRIHKNYPETVRVVIDHESMERRRLGDNYDETYNWR